MYRSDRTKKSSLLKTKKRKRSVMRAYSTLRCPMNGHQVSWCRGLCQPTNGIGLCGRTAPHAMKDRTQVAIARYLNKELRATNLPL